MSSNRSNSRRATAAAATLIFHGAVLAVLLTIFLRYDGGEKVAREWPPVDSSEILFGGEYVMIGDTPEDASAEAVEQSAPAEPREAVAQEPQELLVTQSVKPAPEAIKNPTPPKETAKPVENKPKPTADNDESKRQAATNINNRVKFGDAKGSTGSPDGNSATGAASGVASSGLGNRSAVELPRPARSPLGKIVINIKVNRDGRVTAASFLSGEGAAAADAATRQRCIAAAKGAKFTPSADAPVSQTGTLTYTFK